MSIRETGKPSDNPDIRRSVTKPCPDHNTRSMSEPLPPDLQKLVDAEEQYRVVYEDPWTRTRPSDSFSEEYPDPKAPKPSQAPSQALPPVLQEMVDKEEEHRVVYEDPWTRTRPSDTTTEHPATTTSKSEGNPSGSRRLSSWLRENYYNADRS